MIKALKKFKKRLRAALFNSKVYSVLRNRKHILVLGDSHVNVVKYMTKNSALRNKVMFDHCSVGGATAQGILNPGSKTDARGVFQKRLKALQSFQYLIIQLGEVDCGFVIWYYAEKYGNSVEDQLQRSVDNYCLFIEEVMRNGVDNVSVISAPLPTIKDGQNWGEIAKKRSEVKATQLQRTELTVGFNLTMKERCQPLGIRCIDMTGQMLDSSTGLVKTELLHSNKDDHHLEDSVYSALIETQILELFK